MVPPEGRIRPVISRTITVLPVPEPPTTAITSPRRTDIDSPSWITVVPKRVTRFSTSITTSSAIAQSPNVAKRMEKAAFTMITMKIPATTDWVVSRPTLSASPFTLRPM